jgi:hypothetical protein
LGDIISFGLRLLGRGSIAAAALIALFIFIMNRQPSAPNRLPEAPAASRRNSSLSTATIRYVVIGRGISNGHIDEPVESTFIGSQKNVAAVAAFANAVAYKTQLRFVLISKEGQVPCNASVAQNSTGTFWCQWNSLSPGNYTIYAYADSTINTRYFSIVASPPLQRMTEVNNPTLQIGTGRVRNGEFTPIDGSFIAATDNIAAKVTLGSVNVRRNLKLAIVGPGLSQTCPLVIGYDQKWTGCTWTVSNSGYKVNIPSGTYEVSLLIDDVPALVKHVTVGDGRPLDLSPSARAPSNAPPAYSTPRAQPDAFSEMRRLMQTPGCELLRQDGLDTSGCVQGHIDGNGNLVGPNHF